jgi:glutathione S-transferase
MASTPGPYFLEEFSTADVVFLPYVERMNASLYYYKGYSLRSNPGFAAWFDAMESRETTYRGTQSDFHTHVHDLPPQMGGCYENGSALQQICKQKVDYGPWGPTCDVPEVGFPEPEDAAVEAVARTCMHKEKLLMANAKALPRLDKSVADEALRVALTSLLDPTTASEGDNVAVLPEGADQALRYIRDRVNVPRDMSIWAGRRLRQALEETAQQVAGANISSPVQPPNLAIPKRDRRDQDPRAFAVSRQGGVLGGLCASS